ncbi:MAG: hypothetical protein J5I41_01825 [Saprospiraceae bacterium]|nr:hypothetical protein [Saprospiraceae bacterium]
MKPTPANLQKLEELVRALSYTVRYEKGNFQSGYCMVESRKMIVVNKFFDTAGRFSTLLDILASLPIQPDQLPDKSREFYQLLHRNSLIPSPELG